MRSQRQPNKRLFIGSLPYKFTEGDLLSLFITEGKIIDVRVIHNKWGKSRGLGYVEYENLEDAIRAKEKYHNFNIGDRTIIVDYSEADPFLTPEGRQRHQEALEKKGKKNPQNPPSTVHRGPSRFNLDEPKTLQRPFTKNPPQKIRQSVYDSRTYGSKVGAKFASRNKKERKQ